MKKSNDMHVYAKTIYWTIMNYLQVYRDLGAGMMNPSGIE